MWQSSSALVCMLLVGRQVQADEHIVLPPLTNETSLPSKMLIFIPGGKVPNEHYVSTARSIQAAASAHLRLWVAIPAVFLRLCVISCSTTFLCSPLHMAVESALSKAKDLGWSRGSDERDLFLAGHSLGGVCANTLFKAYRTESSLPYAGLVVMGSYVDEAGGYDLAHYPKPVLILNAELDGGAARPGKTSTWWREHLEIAREQGADFALERKPVVILQGLNHSDFCPGFDVPGDLPADVSQADATAAIGRAVAAFLQVQVGSAAVRDGGVGVLRKLISWTQEFMEPYLALQELERSLDGRSPFCEQAQHIVAGLSAPEDARLTVSDSYASSSSDLERCRPNWSSSGAGRALSVRTCGHADYYADVANTRSITAASELACKMLSSALISQQLNASAARPAADCREANMYAAKLAEEHAPNGTLARFRGRGRGWCFAGDVPTAGGSELRWVFKDSLTLMENATCMTVSSPVLKTDTTSHTNPGSHYCKLLSPARALDWMMTDSLKRPAGLSSEPTLLSSEASTELVV